MKLEDAVELFHWLARFLELRLINLTLEELNLQKPENLESHKPETLAGATHGHDVGAHPAGLRTCASDPFSERWGIGPNGEAPELDVFAQREKNSRRLHKRFNEVVGTDYPYASFSSYWMLGARWYMSRKLSVDMLDGMFKAIKETTPHFCKPSTIFKSEVHAENFWQGYRLMQETGSSGDWWREMLS
tara:strand:- start:27 stop:590 length:564 start_codon:yes stop_codon:yes gene_type:complete